MKAEVRDFRNQEGRKRMVGLCGVVSSLCSHNIGKSCFYRLKNSVA